MLYVLFTEQKDRPLKAIPATYGLTYDAALYNTHFDMPTLRAQGEEAEIDTETPPQYVVVQMVDGSVCVGVEYSVYNDLTEAETERDRLNELHCKEKSPYGYIVTVVKFTDIIYKVGKLEVV